MTEFPYNKNTRIYKLKSGKLAQRLAKKLIDRGELEGKPEHYAIKSHRPGRWQKGNGARSFTLIYLQDGYGWAPGHIDVYGYWSATHLVKHDIELWNEPRIGSQCYAIDYH